MRTGPDLLNIGARQPSRDWHLTHLYNPRLVTPQSLMPPFPWLFEERTSAGPSDAVVNVPGSRAVIVANRDGLDLIEYLLSMNRTYPVR
jgi:cytochrome c oxidase cbb3-type subunit 2